MKILQYEIILRLKKPLPKGGEIYLEYGSGKHKKHVATDFIKGQEDYDFPPDFEKIINLKVRTSI